VTDSDSGTDPRWWVYRGAGAPHDGIDLLPEPPLWRAFDGQPLVDPPATPEVIPRRQEAVARGYRPSPVVVESVNAALYLRRPLLVTGKPGVGKSTLAYSVARELQLGPVLYWPISSRTAVVDGLYQYDAIARLQEAGLHKTQGAPDTKSPAADVGRFIRLGALGTALLPTARPRVLLIDELDKSDVDLPNDLLNVFEEGKFDIPELRRLPADQRITRVESADDGRPVQISGGRVVCHAFPFVVITSNGEREFPPAFLRRCIRLDMPVPDADRLAQIVRAQLGEAALAAGRPLIDAFIARRKSHDLATDQLLNAIYLASSHPHTEGLVRDRLEEILLRPLGGSRT
jgi:MoxR-like ATPase